MSNQLNSRIMFPHRPMTHCRELLSEFTIPGMGFLLWNKPQIMSMSRTFCNIHVIIPQVDTYYLADWYCSS